MTSAKQTRLIAWLEEISASGDEKQIRNIVLLMTLVSELFAPMWLIQLHRQNMARAKFGRHSEAAEQESCDLRCGLTNLANHVKRLGACAESCKKEFIKCNTANTWSQVKPADKAKEELKELTSALVEGQYNERVLDAILDFIYAGTEVEGVHC